MKREVFEMVLLFSPVILLWVAYFVEVAVLYARYVWKRDYA